MASSTPLLAVIRPSPASVGGVPLFTGQIKSEWNWRSQAFCHVSTFMWRNQAARLRSTAARVSCGVKPRFKACPPWAEEHPPTRVLNPCTSHGRRAKFAACSVLIAVLAFRDLVTETLDTSRL